MTTTDLTPDEVEEVRQARAFYARHGYAEGMDPDPSSLNVWGTRKDDVGQGFCPDCERALPFHYDICPEHPRKATT